MVGISGQAIGKGIQQEMKLTQRLQYGSVGIMGMISDINISVPSRSVAKCKYNQ